MSSFRLNAKNFLLTFPQCFATKEQLKDHLVSLGASGGIVCEESHEDGSPHLHAFCHYQRKKDIRNPRFFDFLGFHGRYEASRDVWATISYVKKDGNFIEFGDYPKQKRKWEEVLSAGTKEEALSVASEVSARDFIIFNDRIEQFLDKKFKPERKLYSPKFSNFLIPDEVSQWWNQAKSGDRPKSLIMYGPTRLGKTQLARSFGRHMFFHTYFCLDLWDPLAEYAIFDDLTSWESFSTYKSWLGAQEEFVTTDKYKKKMPIVWGKPCIVLSNQLPMFPDEQWIIENCFIVQITNKLYL